MYKWRKWGRFTRVGLHKNLPDGHQHLWDLELWAPAVVEHLVTQLAIALDVGMVDLRQKLDLEERIGRERISRVADQNACPAARLRRYLRCLEGVLGRHLELQRKAALLVGRLLLRLRIDKWVSSSSSLARRKERTGKRRECR
jgi:hypothetical protein